MIIADDGKAAGCQKSLRFGVGRVNESANGMQSRARCARQGGRYRRRGEPAFDPQAAVSQSVDAQDARIVASAALYR